MKHYKILILVLVIALSLVGSAYANWSEMSEVTSSIHTAQFNTRINIGEVDGTTISPSKSSTSFKDIHNLRVSHGHISHDVTTKYVINLYNAGSVSCRFRLTHDNPQGIAASDIRYYIGNTNGEGMSYAGFIQTIKNRLSTKVSPGHSIRIVVYEKLSSSLPEFTEEVRPINEEGANEEQEDTEVVLIPIYYDWEYELKFDAKVFN